MYKFPPGNPTLSLTAQDPLAVLESPPAELLRGEPHVIPDYPNHQAIHMPIIPALSLGNLEFLLGMFVYESPALDKKSCSQEILFR
ncbi:unnamed protein product [Allacma fusca]|uniref:Uncharacterized protein n=1 Tax=Allacma fusca TaxID=39272 RepID=A0A8J2LUG1_9HEXA|nr:unnamed protein product [Allacma fusca]